MSEKDTKERILDAAEALFAEQGFAHASMRSITSAAAVNLAAVNYHFGSKEGLIKAVFSRRLEPVNSERLRRLERVEAGVPTLESLLEAFIAPHLEVSIDQRGTGDRFVRLLGRSFTEHAQFLNDHVYELNREVIRRFKPSFAALLPHLPKQELSLRLHFVVGAVAHCMAGPEMIRLLQGSQLSEGENARALVARLVPFLAAGLRAPLPEMLPEFGLTGS